MKIILLGFGSIGRRHAANLRALHPDAQLVIADPWVFNTPFAHQLGHDLAIFPDWRDAIIAHPDANAAIIASPTDCHADQMHALATIGVPFYVEKPLGTTMLPRYPLDCCAVGFQYRYHPGMHHIERLAGEHGELRFYARDDLLARYGPHVAGIMAAHPLDTALRLLGPAERVDLHSNGTYLQGRVWHPLGRLSVYDIDMGQGPRESLVSAGPDTVELVPDDRMYRWALRAWLGWVGTGDYVAPLATIADGLAVERVLEEVRYVHSR